MSVLKGDWNRWKITNNMCNERVDGFREMRLFSGCSTQGFWLVFGHFTNILWETKQSSGHFYKLFTKNTVWVFTVKQTPRCLRFLPWTGEEKQTSGRRHDSRDPACSCRLHWPLASEMAKSLLWAPVDKRWTWQGNGGAKQWMNWGSGLKIYFTNKILKLKKLLNYIQTKQYHQAAIWHVPIISQESWQNFRLIQVCCCF